MPIGHYRYRNNWIYWFMVGTWNLSHNLLLTCASLAPAALGTDFTVGAARRGWFSSQCEYNIFQ